MAYGRIPDEARRQSVFFGTTNDATYLRDSTGNRRVWPIKSGVFNLEALTRDVHQLWAEAAMREVQGGSIRLQPDLWPAAATEQAQRLIHDPFYDALQAHIGEDALKAHIGVDLKLDDIGIKISSEAVCEILDLRGGQRTQEHSQRISKVMVELEWYRP